MLVLEEVIPKLYIGDYAASQDVECLRKHNVKSVVAAMRQEYQAAEGITVHRILIDDTASTNIIAHFHESNTFIRAALARGEGVLVHCQAGVSRSTTLVAAFLMEELELEAEQAVDMVRMVRSQVEPTEFFLHQLEMFERCDCEWDPVKWIEQRRFLMGFAQAQIMDGASPSIVLAYYPSPAPSPNVRTAGDPFGSGNSMTPIERNASLARRRNSRSGSAELMNPIGALTLTEAVPARKRLTPRSAHKELEKDSIDPPVKHTVEKIGTKGQVVITGKRIRCKMCRRELAAREHILVHEPGIGQQAFAPHRRDMASHRVEQERRRLDEMEREALQAHKDSVIAAASTASTTPTHPSTRPEEPIASTSSTLSTTTPPTVSLPSHITGLRISQPQHILPGLRMAVPRPRPMARPIPGALPPVSDSSEVLSSSLPPPSSSSVSDVPTSIPLTSRLPAPSLPSSSLSQTNSPTSTSTLTSTSPPTKVEEPPLLPSHLCSSYFVEPLSWMSPLLESGVLAGKIFCPNEKCCAKLGSFDWAGLQCSCGAWVCPGFAINTSRTDEIYGGTSAMTIQSALV